MKALPKDEIYFEPQLYSECPDLFIIAGEHSGDEHAALMVKELLELKPNLKICAIGGNSLKTAGCHLLFDILPYSVVGFLEVLKHYKQFKVIFDKTLEWIERYRPKHICFVDYPGFNLRLAKALYEKKMSVKGGGSIALSYYISPQIWAWKANRKFQMQQWLDALAVILPFEVEHFKATSLPTAFVGHPFLSSYYNLNIAYDKEGPVLLLPGSRQKAVTYILPVLLEAFERYCKDFSDTETSAVIIVPNDELQKTAEHYLMHKPILKNRIQIRQSTEFISGSVVLTSSGTMSLKCALAGIPGAIVYKCNALTYCLGKLFIKIPYLGMCNILLNTPMYPEFIQSQAIPELLAKEIQTCRMLSERLESTVAHARRLNQLLNVSYKLTAGQWLASQLQ
jgi:lipid-A-disaccharide synthase